MNDIVDFIAADSPAAAQRVHASILAAARRLTEFPGMGRTGQIHGTRELPVTATPYIIIYRADSTTVTILAVFHGARDIARTYRERGG